MKKPDEEIRVGTDYFVTPEGEYNKYSHIPNSVRSELPRVKVQGSGGWNYIPAEWTIDDFELAGFAVQCLEEGLKKALEPTTA